MRTKIFFVYIAILFFTQHKVVSQATIICNLDQKNVKVKYFKPFKKFGNYEIPSFINLNDQSNFKIDMTFDQPSFTKMVIGSDVIWLLVEPNDSIHINIDKSNGSDLPYTLTGKNAKGNEYYNLVYTSTPIRKFEGLRSIFEQQYNKDLSVLLKSIRKEFADQVVWVDSLYSIKLVSFNYNQFMKTEIQSILAWETGKLCDFYYQDTSNEDSKNKKSLIKKELFNLVDPLEKRLYSCMLGHAYYDTYFSELYKSQNQHANSSDAIVENIPYFSLATGIVKEYNLGRTLLNYINYSSQGNDLCGKFKKYKQMYPESNEYINFLDESDICSTKENKSK